MAAREEDLQFLRFRRSGDPEALARVFDLTASRLMLLAVHLMHDRAESEDLLQSTFLAAIESADQFEDGRPLLPWLASILTHRAGYLQRRRRVRREQRFDEEPQDDRVPGPLQCVQDRETRERIIHALDAMPVPYRQTLLLHLVHGLRPVAIAHTLDRSPETVRTQLRRGLRMLRESLPKGLAVPSVFALLAGDGLAAVRADVLASALPRTILPAVAGITGAITMKKLSIGLCALLMLAWLGFAILDRGHVIAPGDPPDGATELSADASESRAKTTGAAAEVRQDLATESAPATEEPELAKDEIRLIGRCVDSVTKAPVAWCVVRVSGWSLNSEAMAAHGRPVVFERPAPLTTESNGRFEFRFRPPPPYQFALDIDSPDYPKVSGRWASLQPGLGETVDFGDVLLRLGCRVTGRIVDESGAAQTKIQISFDLNAGMFQTRSAPSPGWGELGVPTYFYALSGADGAFSCVLPGRNEFWHIKSLSGRQLVRPQSLTIENGQVSARIDVAIRAKRPDEYISGVLVDSDDRPVARATLSAVASSGSGQVHGPFWTSTSRKDGTFKILKKDVTTPRVRIKVHAEPRAGIEERTTPTDYPWGTNNLRIVVPASPSIDVTVVEASTGKPVEDFGVRVFLDPRLGPVSSAHLRQNGHHPGGKLRVEGIGRGRNFLTVEPTGDHLMPSWLSVVDVSSAGAKPQRVELHRPVERQLVVVYKDGRPVSGTRVQLVREIHGKPVTLVTTVLPRGKLDQLRGPSNFGFSFTRTSSSPGMPTPAQIAALKKAQAKAKLNALQEALLVQEGTTDRTGRLRLTGPPDRGLALRILGPGHPACTVNGVNLAGQQEPLRVTVASGATIKGVLTPEGATARFSAPGDKVARAKGGHDAANQLARLQPRLRLSTIPSDHSSALPPFGEPGYPIARNGGFEIRGIPPGAWRISLETHVGRMDLVTVSGLREGEVRRLDLDVGSFLPGEIVGRVYIDGEVLANQTVRPMRIDVATGYFFPIGQPVPTDARGVFRVEVRPDRYLVEVQMPATGAMQPRKLRTPAFEVAPATKMERTFQLHRIKLTLRVLLADGETPFANRELTYANQAVGGVAGKTDAEGWIVLDPVASTPLRLAVWPPDVNSSIARLMNFKSRTPLDAIRLPAGKKEVQRELRLPRGLK